MWDVTCDVAWRELRQAVEAGEEVDWGDYIPFGELVPPGDVEAEDRLDCHDPCRVSAEGDVRSPEEMVSRGG
jgi:hypothetical protein